MTVSVGFLQIGLQMLGKSGVALIINSKLNRNKAMTIVLTEVLTTVQLSYFVYWNYTILLAHFKVSGSIICLQNRITKRTRYYKLPELISTECCLLSKLIINMKTIKLPAIS